MGIRQEAIEIKFERRSYLKRTLSAVEALNAPARYDAFRLLGVLRVSGLEISGEIRSDATL